MKAKIKIRHVCKATELKRFGELEGEYHHMGETHSGGDTMRVVFEDERGEWLALMVWGSAVYHLRPRDEYIGWNTALRAARRKLVVNNRRFTVLSRPGAHPNLASRCLGLAMRELPKMWLRKFHYRPLLAETFCDISRSSRRDGAYCEDIRTRRCDENVTGAMMLARTLALFFFARSGMTNCQSFKESLQANPDRAFDLVMRNEA